MVSSIDKYVIQKVKELRLNKGFSQSRLAFELEQSNSFIAKVESGKYGKKYNIYHLNQIAIIFECSPKDFLPKEPLKED